MKVKISNARLSFPDLFTPRAFQPGQEPKYKATLLIPKGDPQCKVVEDAIMAVAQAKWGAKAASVIKGIRGNAMRFNWQDGETKDYDGYAGMMALSASSKSRPLVIDRDKSPLSAADGKPYAGCYVAASVEFFAYDNSGNGISATLKGIQFIKDGDAFGGGAPASPDDFDDLGVDETADDLAG